MQILYPCLSYMYTISKVKRCLDHSNREERILYILDQWRQIWYIRYSRMGNNFYVDKAGIEIFGVMFTETASVETRHLILTKTDHINNLLVSTHSFSTIILGVSLLSPHGLDIWHQRNIDMSTGEIYVLRYSLIYLNELSTWLQTGDWPKGCAVKIILSYWEIRKTKS